MSMQVTKIYADGGINYFLETIRDMAGNGTGMDYYTTHGDPPGVWLGDGCESMGVVSGTVATKSQIENLFNNLAHPVTGKPLTNDGTGSRRKRMSRRQAPVAGFDLTATIPKSVSVIWASADAETRKKIEELHHRAIDESLKWWKENVAYTRIGRGGAIQTKVKGITAVRFDHYSNRNGDPNLHSHIAVSNIVLRQDDMRGTLDGRVIYEAQVAFSERHSNVLRDLLRKEMGLTFEPREGLKVKDKAVVLDVKGVPADLIEQLSSRGMQAAAEEEREIADRERDLGRKLTFRELADIQEKAFQRHRKAKDRESKPIETLIREWREQMRKLGFDPAAIMEQVRQNGAEPVLDGIRLARDTDLCALIAELAKEPANAADRFANDARAVDAILNEATKNATTVTRFKVRSTVERLTALIPMEPGTRDELVDTVTERVLGNLVLVTPHRYELPAAAVNDGFLDAGDGVSVTADKPSNDRWATQRLLDAERYLRDIADRTIPGNEDSDRSTRERIGTLLDEYAAGFEGEKGYPMGEDQLNAARTLLESDRRITALTGPAGTGKTTTARAIKHVFDRLHGEGRIIGMSTGGKAAGELGQSLGIETVTIAKFLHYNSTSRADDMRSRIAELEARSRKTGGLKDHEKASLLLLRTQLRALEPPRDGIVLIDEASMASNMDLARIMRILEPYNTRVILLGDHKQLNAPGEGSGYLGWMHRTKRDVELTEIHRFEDPEETEATRALRESTLDEHGDTVALELYSRLGERAPDAPMGRITPAMQTDNDAGRIHGGSGNSMQSKAYQRTLDALLEGRTAVLAVATNEDLTLMNRGIELALKARGIVDADPSHAAETADGLGCAPGSVIITRQNNARIRASNGDQVYNGDLWKVRSISPQGVVTATRKDDEGHELTVSLPADYVKKHVELGYAVTAHRCQGATVDESNLWVPLGSGLSANTLYVAMTRGRRANNVWIDTPDTHQLKDTHEYTRWCDINQTELEKRGLKPWKGTDPAPEGYYTLKDIEPTPIQLAKARFADMAADSRDPLMATEQYERHVHVTHSLDRLLADRDTFMDRIMVPRLETILKDTVGATTADAIANAPAWNHLINSFAKAQAIDETKTRTLIAGTVKECTQGTTSEGMLLDVPDATDTAMRIAKTLDERIVNPAAGNHPDWVAGICPPVTAHPDDDGRIASTIDMVRQADEMIEAKARSMALDAAETGAQTWARKLPAKPGPAEPERVEQWENLVRDIWMYRTQWKVESDNPMGPKPDGRDEQQAQWANLTDRWLEYRDGLKPGKAREMREYARRLRQAGHAAPDPVEATPAWLAKDPATVEPAAKKDPIKTEGIAKVNERVWSHWLETVPGSWAEPYMAERGLDPGDAGYAPAEWTATMQWAMRNGIPLHELEEAGLVTQGRNGLRDTFSDRLCLPVRDREGLIIAFTGRRNPATPDAGPKYINNRITPAYDKGIDLYGMDQTAVADLMAGSIPVICEGAMDAEALRKAAPIATGISGQTYTPLAPCGTGLTDRHLATLRELNPYADDLNHPILCFDTDSAGMQATLRAWTMLTPDERAGGALMLMPEGVKDPGEMMQTRRLDELAAAMNTPRPLWKTIIDMSSNDLDLRWETTQTAYRQRIEDTVIQALPVGRRDEARGYLADAIRRQAEASGAEWIIRPYAPQEEAPAPVQDHPPVAVSPAGTGPAL